VCYKATGMKHTADNDFSSKRVYVLFMLLVVYTFNFLDRQILSILAIPVKADLGLSDTQLGLLGGTAFALFYTTLGIPVALLADRYSRTTIMTVALALWSAMTAACGLAHNFWQLFATRLGVGVGEAGGVAPAYSLISDYFPSGQRARALSVYSFGVPLGTALGMLIGGIVASTLNWRYAFIAVGLAGVLLAPVFRLTVPEPPRGRLDPPSPLAAATLRQILGTLKTKTGYWLICLGASSASIIGYGVFFWLPSVMVRSHGMTLIDASLFMATLFLTAGIVGIWLGGWAADRYGRTNRAMYALIPAAAFVLCTPLYAIGIFATSLPLAFVFLFAPMALSLAWLGPVLSTIQHLVPPTMRVTASAVYLFLINLIGLGLGTVIIGGVSDALTVRFAEDALRYAMLSGLSLYLVAALLFMLGARQLARDWEE